MSFLRKTTDLPTPGDALPDRDTPIPVTRTHLVVGMGCFWGADSPF
jgi:hypothetical protein